MINKKFKIESPYEPAGDQPQAIKELCEGLERGDKSQVLLGVTGSGKTFTMAKIIEQSQRPALIMAPNKILAAQLYSEMKEFFPDNHVEYFVSYYDYYQPEAYVPKTDTYIEKDSAINEQIDRMRNAATRNILECNDVIIIASVSCIYGLGDVESYSAMTIDLHVGEEIEPKLIYKRLAELQYERNQQNFVRSTFRVNGDVLDIFPAHYEDRGWRISFFGDEIESICEFDSLTGKKTADLRDIVIYPANHYVTPRPALSQAMVGIRKELAEQLEIFRNENKLVEAQRLEQRTRFDLEMLETTGHCKGIENYSRYLTGAKPATRRQLCLNTFLPTQLFLLTKATFPFRKSAECSAATATVKARWHNTVSACLPALTIVRSVLKNGTRCAARVFSYPPRPVTGNWNKAKAFLPNRSFADRASRPGLYRPPG